MSALVFAARQLGDFRGSSDVAAYVMPGIAQLGN
jgi:hypothetical protein